MAPALLQTDPGPLFEHLGDLVYLVLFIAAALIPIVKGWREGSARRKAAKAEDAGAAPMQAPPRPEPEPEVVSQTDLEERVRRYFEELAGGPSRPKPAAHEPRPQAAPAPRPAPPPARPASPQPAVLQKGGLAVMDEVQVDREGLKQRRSALPQRPVDQKAKRTPLRRTLRQRSSLRQAVVLREILGPPKSLE
ncbi:MAG: hypothetical protein HY812_15855 [Planctomycetes bacterium]|nr:hypothetical protein [Planctomycetota bacterium]